VNESEYKLWTSRLSLLTSAQRSDAAVRLQLLGNQKENNGKQEFGNRLLQVICDVMKKNNVEIPNPNTLRKSAAYVSARDKINDLSIFFESISKSKLVQDSILREGVQLLYNDLLQWQNIAISSHTLLKQCHRVPSTLNKNYPGYAASGLLTKIVRGV
jgi:hypothetical protein